MNNPTKLLPTDLILVEVPEDATEIQVWNHGVGFKTKLLNRDPDDTNGFYHTATGLGRWRNFELLGEVTADSISFSVDPYLKSHNFYEDKSFFYNENNIPEFKTANEALYSLLQSNGIYFVNPIKFPGCECKCDDSHETFLKCDERIRIWKSYESKLIKKGVILKKL